MADGLTINQASFRQQEKLAARNCRRSGQFSSREDREVLHEIRCSVSPSRKPFAIAQEFGDAKIQHSNRCEISGLAARPGEETGAGCGLAQSRTSDERFLRRVESLTHQDTFQGAVDKKTANRLTASSSRRARASQVRGSARSSALTATLLVVSPTLA
jgi:hypothetical protein